jgi:hypothetical protein
MKNKKNHNFLKENMIKNDNLEMSPMLELEKNVLKKLVKKKSLQHYA